MLHIVNKSLTESDKLETCLRFTQAGHAVLLIENAVYAALAASAMAGQWPDSSSGITVYVLTPDLAARGLLDRPMHPGIRQIDYPGFVRLVTEHEVAQSW